MSEQGDAAPRTSGPNDAMSFATEVARLVADAKSRDVVLLDLRGLSALADFFVIGTGTSDRQMHAVLDQIRTFARDVGRKPLSIADTRAGSWILADYVDVVVHLFDEEHREYYDLEGLWSDAPRIEWQQQVAPASPA